MIRETLKGKRSLLGGQKTVEMMRKILINAMWKQARLPRGFKEGDTKLNAPCTRRMAGEGCVSSELREKKEYLKALTFSNWKKLM